MFQTILISRQVFTPLLYFFLQNFLLFENSFPLQCPTIAYSAKKKFCTFCRSCTNTVNMYNCTHCIASNFTRCCKASLFCRNGQLYGSTKNTVNLANLKQNSFSFLFATLYLTSRGWTKLPVLALVLRHIKMWKKHSKCHFYTTWDPEPTKCGTALQRWYSIIVQFVVQLCYIRIQKHIHICDKKLISPK